LPLLVLWHRQEKKFLHATSTVKSGSSRLSQHAYACKIRTRGGLCPRPRGGKTLRTPIARELLEPSRRQPVCLAAEVLVQVLVQELSEPVEHVDAVSARGTRSRCRRATARHRSTAQ